MRTGTKFISVPPVPLPASLLAQCPTPDIPENFTWGESLELNEKLLTSLQACNRDKATIRQIEYTRVSAVQLRVSH